MKDKEKLSPDFFQIPYRLVMDKNLTPTDRIIYGAIYFFANMSGKRCFASNSVLAALVGSSAMTVSHSLNRLEEHGYIFRAFSDPDIKARRVEIIPTITMNQKMPRQKVVPSSTTGVVSGSTTRGIPASTPIVSGSISGYTKRYNPKNGSKSSVDKEEMAQQSHESPIKEDQGVIPPGTESNKKSNNNYKEDIIIDADASKKILNGPDLETIWQIDNVMAEPEKTTDTVNDAIALFLTILPGDFIGSKNAFAKPPTREAVAALLKRYTVKQLKDMIAKYDAGKTDQYRPQVGTVYEFCTTKLAKIEAYVSKNVAGSGLYAQRNTVNDPEHRKKLDEQQADFLARQRRESEERREKNKAEWERTHPKTK